MISYEKVELYRGEEYIIDFYINGNLWDIRLEAIKDSVYDFTFDSKVLMLKESCLVKGRGITIVASLGKTEISEKTVIPEFNPKIVAKGAYDIGSERGLVLEYQAGITNIKYKIEDTYRQCLIDSEGGEVSYGKDFELDLTTDLHYISDTMEYASISIDSVEVLTADNTLAVYKVEERDIVMSTKLAWVGSGTQADPYQVTSIAHFNDIQSKNASGVYFKQMYDLNFNNTATTRNVRFDGIYDGNGKNIYNIRITSSTPLYDGGLFDRNYGTIKNIRRITVTMTYSHWGFLGGMVGYNSGLIKTPIYSTTNEFGLQASISVNCSSSTYGVIIGGVAGFNSGTIRLKNTVSVNITSNEIIGGIAGENTGGIVSDSFITPRTIRGSIYFNYLTSYFDDVGGIAGINNGGTISMIKINIYFNLSVPSTNSSYQPRVGGLVGRQENSGSIFGYEFIGSYSSNLTVAQSLYVDFYNDYIGQLLP